MKRLCLLLTCLVLTFAVRAQFLHTSGTQIVDQQNNVVVLRGMGLGGWMLQEPYMLEMSGFAVNQRDIRNKIQNLIGAEKTIAFYDAWLANHCTRRDIDSLAKWGFNSVRLPLHYNLFTLPVEAEPVPGTQTWLDKGFALTDSLIKWCTANKMYVILDLHAAPGGQGRDAAISDYDASKPSLWESPANRTKTVALWRKLAERYAGEPYVGGYDLINEPNWNFTTGANQNGCDESANVPMWDLYRDIVAAIRTVDHQHLVIVEGNCWGNNHRGFAKLDNNMVVSFHKYWSNNDVGAISGFLNLSNSQSVPLWMGESGENSNQWAKDAIDLVEGYGIGWAWWPLKKVNTVVNPLTVKKNGDYANLLTWLHYGGTAPPVDVAYNALMTLANNLKTENTTFHKDFVDAMFRQHNSNSTIPFAHHVLPGTVHLTDFDLGPNGYAYKDTEVANYQVSSGTYTAWNNGWAYRNDGVDIEASADADANANGFNVGWTDTGEWMQYTVTVDSSAAYNITVRYAAQSNGSAVRLNLGGRDLAAAISLPATGGNQTWGEVTLNDVLLTKGTQPLRVIIDQGGMNLGHVTFTLSKLSSAIPFQPVTAETDTQGNALYVNCNKAFNAATVSASGISCTVNGTATTIQQVTLTQTNPFQLTLTLGTTLSDADVIKLSYSGTTALATDGSALQAFTDLTVKNNLPVHLAIPGTIEAEQFETNKGWVAENCTDSGGGKDMGYTNTGDQLIYDVRVATTGNYTLEVRSACNASAGIIDVDQLDGSGQVLNTKRVNIPVTGGWQSWTTVKVTMPLTAGAGKLRVTVVQPEFNLNWYRFTELLVSGVKPDPGAAAFYPNPANDRVYLAASTAGLNRVVIRNLAGQVVQAVNLQSGEAGVDVSDLAEGLYLIEHHNDHHVSRSRLLIRR